MPNKGKNKISVIAVIAAIASAFFAALTWYYSTLQYKTFKEQIQYIAILDRKTSNDKYGTLELRQVSGQAYILTGITIVPSIENQSGGYINAEPFSFGLIEYLKTEKSLPRYEISNIGEIICHKRQNFEDLPCNPSENFTIKYSYKIFDDERKNHQALVGRNYHNETK